jgi:hypothetical protein
MKIRKYFWLLNIIGGIITLIAVLTPTSYNDTGPTLYYIWMNQIGVDVDPLAIYLLRTDVMLVLFSTILALIIFSSALIAISLTNVYLRASLTLKKLRWKVILLAILIIASTLSWIIMMELFYNQYGANHWTATGGGYSPYFGVIGPFIGAAFIVFGSFARRE